MLSATIEQIRPFFNLILERFNTSLLIFGGMNKSSPSTVTFVLHFRLERSISQARWRGSIEHIPSGKRSEFLRIEDLLHFFRKFEIRLDDTDCLQEKLKDRE